MSYYQLPNNSTEHLVVNEGAYKFISDGKKVSMESKLFMNMIMDLNYAEGLISGMQEGIGLLKDTVKRMEDDQ